VRSPHLPEPRLLDAARIDGHLIGIDPDFRIHVSDRLREIHDGPFLKLGGCPSGRHKLRISGRAIT
jgi:putative restriction endonuclease